MSRSGRVGSRLRPSERGAYLLLLAVVAVALYARNLDDYFLGDDFDLIHSVYGRSLLGLVELLWTNESGDVLRSLGIDEALGYGYLRPLKMWTFALDLAIWGANPLGYHLTVTALFVLHGVFVFLLVEMLAPGRPVTALLAGGLVVLSPVFAPLVPWVNGRDELVASAASVAAVWAFLRFRRSGGALWLYYALYVAALLGKETAIVVAGLPVAYDAVHGRFSPRDPARLRASLRTHAPILAIWIAYFGLRYFAFGNFAGGGGPEVPREFTSVMKLATFQLQVFEWLLGPRMFAFSELAGAGFTLLLLLAGAGAALFALRGRMDAGRRADLLFAGPLWYLCSISILFGTYFSERHHVMMIVGFAIFAALGLDTLMRVMSVRRERALVAATLAVSAFACVPPGQVISRQFDQASQLVASMRDRIERETRSAPDGSRILVTGVPQWTHAPYFFGWSLVSALGRPFTESDLAGRAAVYNRRHFQLMELDHSWPERFDQVVDLGLPESGR